jgi:uncharacterized protein
MPCEPKNAVRLVIDTNTVVSGLLWGGTPRALIRAAIDQRLTMIASDALVSEFRKVIFRPKFTAQLAKHATSATNVQKFYETLVTIVTPGRVEAIIERDPDDDEVLAAAFTGHADLIVSGDAHLLDLVNWRGIQIVKAKEALDLIVQTQAQRLA